MSEFSASYHLKSNNRDKAVQLIKSSGNKGYVFEEANGWVTFLIEGSAFDIDETLISCNPGLLVHYIYAEDHGWEFRVFNKDDLVFDYGCDWTDELSIEKRLYDLDVIKELIVQQGNSISNVEVIFDGKEMDWEEPPAYRLAEWIGLTNYEWVSADYYSDDDVKDKVIYVG